MVPKARHDRTRRTAVELVAWVVVGALATIIYFVGYSSNNGSHPGVAIQHPLDVAKFFLLAVGNVIPITSSTDLFDTEALGFVLFLAAVVVVARSWQEQRRVHRIPLPVALIVFAVLFDLSAAMGRLSYGVSYGLQARYEMPNLVLLVAVVAHGLAQFPAGRLSEKKTRLNAFIQRESWPLLFGLFSAIGMLRHRPAGRGAGGYGQPPGAERQPGPTTNG